MPVKFEFWMSSESLFDMSMPHMRRGARDAEPVTESGTACVVRIHFGSVKGASVPRDKPAKTSGPRISWNS